MGKCLFFHTLAGILWVCMTDLILVLSTHKLLSDEWIIKLIKGSTTEWK